MEARKENLEMAVFLVHWRDNTIDEKILTGSNI